MSYWKVPITTEIYRDFGKDHLGRDLFIHLLLRARNVDMEEVNFYEGKPFLLKKGQVIFGQNGYAKRLRCSGTGAYKALCRLRTRQGTYQIRTEPNNNYTVVTIINYDLLTSFNSLSNNHETKRELSENLARTTNKSAENARNKKEGAQKFNFKAGNTITQQEIDLITNW